MRTVEAKEVSSARASASDPPFRVHVINDPSVSPELFHITQTHIDDALAAEPELRARTEFTVGLGEDGLDAAAAAADAIIAFRYPHREFMASARRLRWIHQIGAGVEHLMPLDWLPDDVILTNSSGVHAQKAGEFVACALLALNNRLPVHVTHQRNQRWVQTFSDCIDGKVVLIVGVGQMGGAGARRAQALGLHVIGVNRSGRPHPDVDEMHTVAQLNAVLPRADFVVVTTPLTQETTNLIDAAALSRMKRGAGLINMSRARVVDYVALAERLRSDALSGAILDVFDPEPLPAESGLWDCPNLILTPHVSSDPLDYLSRVMEVFVENLRRLLTGRPLANQVARDREY